MNEEQIIELKNRFAKLCWKISLAALIIGWIAGSLWTYFVLKH